MAAFAKMIAILEQDCIAGYWLYSRSLPQMRD
jgi:hypothetical protein